MNVNDQKILAEMADLVAVLYARWRDEKEFEDFADYKLPIQNFLLAKASGWTLVSMSRRPFGLVVDCNGERRWMKATMRQVNWGRYISKEPK